MAKDLLKRLRKLTTEAEKLGKELNIAKKKKKPAVKRKKKRPTGG